MATHVIYLLWVNKCYSNLNDEAIRSITNQIKHVFISASANKFREAHHEEILKSFHNGHKYKFITMFNKIVIYISVTITDDR